MNDLGDLCENVRSAVFRERGEIVASLLHFAKEIRFDLDIYSVNVKSLSAYRIRFIYQFLMSILSGGRLMRDDVKLMLLVPELVRNLPYVLDVPATAGEASN